MKQVTGKKMRRSLALSLLVGAILATPLHAQNLPAFPGATGPGGFATGGRGGDVYHVTRLDPDKDGVLPGSLQYGINNAPSAGRTIVFDVGGTIYHNGLTSGDRLRYGKANITIAGQTAPGPGITIAGTGTKWTGDNIVLRNITIRPNRNTNGTTHDAFDMQLKNSIVDHVTATWFTDEGISQTDSGFDSTFQYAIVAEGLNYEGHSYGSIIATEVDGTHVSFNHNLYAHNNSRLPRIGSETGATGAVLDWTNNVIYNWQSRAGYSGTDQQSRSNFVANYYIKGPNNGTTAFRGGDDASSVGYTQIYQTTSPSLANKFDDDKDNQLHDGIIFGPTTTLPNSSGQKAYSGNHSFVSRPFEVDGAATPETADVALDRVLAFGGANWVNRNPIEQRIVGSVSTNTGGIINDLSSGPQTSEWATVLSEQAAITRAANFDTDGDGMPDDWEREHGLDTGTANNNGDFDTDGYTDLEEYLNDIAAWPAANPLVFTGAVSSRYAQIQNWDVSWQPSKYDTAVINNGTVVVDAVGQHAGNLVLGMNPGNDATLNITSGWIRVEDAEHGLSDGVTVIGDDPDATAVLNLSGGRLTTQTLLKGSGGVFNFTGGVLSAETVGFDLVNQGGLVAPGASVGMTEVLGDLDMVDGSVEIEVASSTEADFLSVAGTFTLGGALDVALVDGFSPVSGSWTIATASSFLGSFDSVTPGFEVALQGSDLVLSRVGAPIPGDANGDGAVDILDLDILSAHFGAMGGATYASGDFNGDSNVDILDLDILSANFGATNSAAVPEPATLYVALTAMLLGTRRKPLIQDLLK